jgi:mRNA-degrading endonuclease toxin of MazEF toxin-antitoxin module
MIRGEIWLADLGLTGKIRPVLILSVPPGDADRALVTYVTRTTSVRGTAYEVAHEAKGFKTGVFDAQGLGTTDRSRMIRRLGKADQQTIEAVERAVRRWLSL